MNLTYLRSKGFALMGRFMSTVLILAGMAALVGFAATFGMRWALLAAFPCLLVLGVGVDR